MSKRLRLVVGGLAAIALAAMVWRLTASRRASPSRTAEQRVQVLDRSLHALEDGQRKIARDTWDPDYVVTMVGRNPQMLFAWVRDNTYWIPYHGVLRGPVGVLMDRQGNSLDRAILLAKLMERAGYTVRLAHGDLTRDQVRDLLPKLEASRNAAFAQLQPVSAPQPGIHIATTRYPKSSAAADDGLRSQREAFSRIGDELQSRVADQTGRLLKLLGPPNSSELRTRLLESATTALADHWWVQVRNRAAIWVDFDLFAGRAGATVVPAKETATIKDLNANLHHTVTIRVIAEQWSGGTLSEHKTLEQVLRPSDLYGHSVTLQFFPGEWFESDTLSSQHSRAGALAQHQWDAFLAVDRYPLTAGILLENGDDPNTPPKGGDLGGIAAGFSASMGLTRKNDNRQLSAVWVEYEIQVPGEKPRTIRRTVFDLIGAATRSTSSLHLALDDSKRLTRSLALTMKTEILPISCGLSPQFVSAVLTQNLVTDRDLLNFLITGDLPAGSPNLEQLVGHSEPPLSTLFGLALARLELTNKGQLFINQPNILTRHLYAAPYGDAVALLDGTDIVANEIGVALSVRDPFAARLAQGVLDTNAESLFQPGANASVSVGDAFAISHPWAALASTQDAASISKLRLPDDVRDAISNDLNAGYAVVAPERVVSVPGGEFAGWWRIDRTTGDALGMGANGWGAALPEYGSRISWSARIGAVVKVKIAAFAVAFAFNYGWCVTPLVLKSVDKSGVLHDTATLPHGVGENYARRKYGYSLGIWEGAIKPSVGECVGDSVFIAGITAWLLPVGVAEEGAAGEGATPKGQSEPIEPNGSKAGSGGGKGVGANKSSNAPSEANRPSEANPDQNPRPDKPKPCDEASGASGSSEPDNGPPTAPNPEPLVQAQQNYNKANAEYQTALQNDIAALKAVFDYNETRYYTGKNQPGWDPAVDQQLRDAMWKAGAEHSAAVQKVNAAWRDLVQTTRTAQNQRANDGSRAGAACNPTPSQPPPPPPAIPSLDPALNRAPQTSGTQPGLGPSYADPLIDPNGPATIPDPQFTDTQPSPNAPPTAPDPQLADTQPANSSPNEVQPNQTPSATPPQTFDGKPCSYCSTPVPTPPDTSPDNLQKIHNSPAPPPSNATNDPIAHALSDLVNALRGGPVTGGPK